MQIDKSLSYLRQEGDRLMAAGVGVAALVALGIGAHTDQWALAATGASLGVLATGVLLWKAHGQWFNSVALPIVLAAMVGLHIQLGFGKVEYHFGVFVTLALLLTYRHWLPIITGAASFAVHHVVFDRLQAAGQPVYCLTEASFGEVVVHAGYVVAQAGVGCVMARRMRADARLMQELEAVTHGLSDTGAPAGAAAGDHVPSRISFNTAPMDLDTREARQLHTVFTTVDQVVQQVRQSVHQVAHAADRIAQGTNALADRSAAATDAIAQTGDAVRDLRDQVSQTHSGAQRASASVAHVVQLAQEGQSSAQTLATRMGAISQSAQRIRDITGAIDAIAFQTNMLALNAAVESARAGEAGRGFAVVANEVRNLSQRSAEAAREARELIAESVAHIEAGVSVAEGTTAMLTAIGGEAQTVDRLMAEVAQGAMVQHQRVEAIAQTFESLHESVAQNAQQVEESRETADDLRRQCEAVGTAMAVFAPGTGEARSIEPERSAPELLAF